MIGVDGAVYLIRRGLSDRASGIFLFRLFSLAFAGSLVDTLLVSLGV